MLVCNSTEIVTFKRDTLWNIHITTLISLEDAYLGKHCMKTFFFFSHRIAYIVH